MGCIAALPCICVRIHLCADTLTAEEHNDAALLDLESGALKSALQHMHRATRLDDQHAEYANNMGVVYWRMGKLEHAVLSFEQALGTEPEHGQ